MEVSKFCFPQAFFFFFLLLIASTQASPSSIFREYIGAEFNNVKFSDVPINTNVEFHFIFPSLLTMIPRLLLLPPTANSTFSGTLRILVPPKFLPLKARILTSSLGGDSMASGYAYFNPSSIDSWVSNAVSSLTDIIKQYNLDGIDIDYEHFKSDPNTFSECIGRLIKTLKNNCVIKFASITPFNDPQVQSYYKALWNKYGDIIDYVNFQFYAYDKGTSVSHFIDYLNTQSKNYGGGRFW